MKIFLYVILALLLVYIVLALFGPKEIKVERTISINKSADVVKGKLGDFKYFHDEWSPWSEKDPNMKNTYTGNPGEVGHLYSWEGNKDVGKGEMELMALNGDSIIERLFFEGMGNSKVYFIAENKDVSTELTWGMISQIGFMGRPFMLFMNMDKMLGADFEKGLLKLKTKLESTKDETSSTYDIKEEKWEEKTYVGKRSVISTIKQDSVVNDIHRVSPPAPINDDKKDFSGITAFFMENFPKLFADLGKNKIEMLGAPSGIFFKWEETQTDMAAVMCVPNGKEVKGWEKWVVPASTVVHVAYYGPDAGSMGAHNAIGEYLKKNNKEQAYVVEEYVTDRDVEKDSTKWLTNIYYVLK